METRKDKTNELTIANAVRFMFKNMKSGKTLYLAFSKRTFHILIFVMAMDIIANIALINLLISNPLIDPIYIIQFTLSFAAIVSGIWLFFKGINIATDK